MVFSYKKQKRDINISHNFHLAEKMGFEPMQDLHPLAVFETAPFNRLGTSPKCGYYNT